MTGAGCPVFPLETGADCVFHSLSPARVSVSSLRCAVFYLCRHCDRGQRYCSSRFREKSRCLQRREANRRHQQTPDGRADHRDRQREYRQRLKTRVTDQSSLHSSPCANLTAPPARELVEAPPAPVLRPSPATRSTTGW